MLLSSQRYCKSFNLPSINPRHLSLQQPCRVQLTPSTSLPQLPPRGLLEVTAAQPPVGPHSVGVQKGPPGALDVGEGRLGQGPLIAESSESRWSWGKMAVSIRASW